MGSIATKRSIMTLYSDPLDIYSHRVRIVLAEKGIAVDILEVRPEEVPKEVIDVNPYNTLPTLLDRDLVLYNSHIIMEYLDERFPHPPLLPVYPVARAKNRLMMYRIERDWYSLLEKITKNDDGNARAKLRDSLTAIAPAFTNMQYLFSEEFSLLDCCLAPLLWRLPTLDIELPSQADPILDYADRMFERSSFQASLTELERELREPLYA